jgi:aldehyde dehydrogenase (NAD+)
MDIRSLVTRQKEWFQSDQSKSVAFRIGMLKRLDQAIRSHEEAILAALKDDLGKSATESYMTELGIVYDELRWFLKRVKRLARPKRVPTQLTLFAATSWRIPEPFGTVLIMSPWNYPFQLAIVPLVGAIAAGNTAVVKPASYTPNVSRVIAKILAEAFDPSFVACVEGGRAENQALLDQPFDMIFFTGSTNVGKLVMQKASEHLAPVVLELGGKSPCIVDSDRQLALTARRIAFGKFINAGQTCVAPDYLLVKRPLVEPLVALLKKEIEAFFGPDPLNNPDYPKIVNAQHVARLQGLIAPETVLHGGRAEGQKIEPTILGPVDLSAPIMQEEIFGPILPILPYDDRDTVFATIRSIEKPLALYLFADDRAFEKEVVERLSFGGATFNDTIMHFASRTLGFGGVGASGMGRYHGIHSFEAFSHYKGVLKRAKWIDLWFRYHPFTKSKEALLRRFLK